MQIWLLSLLTLSYVLNVAKVATGAKTVHIIIFVIFVGCPHTQLICVEPPNMDPDHQSVFTVAKLITVLLIVGTGPGTTGKSLDRHQML